MLLRVAIVTWLVASSTGALIKKCCREGESVKADVVESNNLVSRTSYSCSASPIEQVKSKSRRFQRDDSKKSNSSRTTQVIGYNLLIDMDTHWPACGERSLVALNLSDPRKVSQTASCVDVLNGHYFVFTCENPLESAADFVDIFRMRKCCDVDFAYDIFARRCVLSNETSSASSFSELLHDKVVAFESGLPDCELDEVLVEYHSHVHPLLIKDNSLVLTSTSLPGPTVLSSFCIENTINSTINFTDAEEIHPKLLSKWIAKTCQPRKKVCDKMPCVRKCCRDGSRLLFQDETSFCEPHESHINLKFYDFDISQSPEVPNAIEPSGESSETTRSSAD
jgi:hypothetical protein